jgi:hypothetical protein
MTAPAASQRPAEAATQPRRRLELTIYHALTDALTGITPPSEGSARILAAADEYAAALIEQCARPSWPRGEGQT